MLFYQFKPHPIFEPSAPPLHIASMGSCSSFVCISAFCALSSLGVVCYIFDKVTVHLLDKQTKSGQTRTGDWDDVKGEYAPFKKTIQRKSYGITAQSKPLCAVIPQLLRGNLHAILKPSMPFYFLSPMPLLSEAYSKRSGCMRFPSQRLRPRCS